MSVSLRVETTLTKNAAGYQILSRKPSSTLHFEDYWPKDSHLGPLGMSILDFLQCNAWNGSAKEQSIRDFMQFLTQALDELSPTTRSSCIGAILSYLDSSDFIHQGKWHVRRWWAGEVTYTCYSEAFMKLRASLHNTQAATSTTSSSLMLSTLHGIKQVALYVLRHPKTVCLSFLALSPSALPKVSAEDRIPSCSAALTLGAVSSLALHHPLPLLPALLSCFPLAHSEATDVFTDSMQSFEALVNEVSFMTTSLSDSIGDHIPSGEISSTALIQHMTQVALDIVWKIHSVMHPISTAINAAKLAMKVVLQSAKLAHQAMGALSTLEHLTQMNQQINTLHLALQHMEAAMQSKYEAGLSILSTARKELQIDFITQQIQESNSMLLSNYQILETLKAKIEKSQTAIIDLENLKDKAEKNLQRLHEELDQNPSTSRYNEVADLIEEWEGYLQTSDLRLSEHANAIDQWQKQIAEQNSLIQEGQDIISELKRMQQERLEILSTITSAHQQLNTQYQEARQQSNNYRQLVNTFSSQLRTELDQAHQRLNHGNNEDL